MNGYSIFVMVGTCVCYFADIIRVLACILRPTIAFSLERGKIGYILGIYVILGTY